MSTDDVVGLSVDAGLATLTLSRAGASNALDRAVKEQLLAALEKVAADDAVRALLLRADGKNFCVGQDLAEHVAGLEADPAHAMDTVAEHYNPLLRALAGIRVPVIVAINGACVGAGLGIALAGDIRIAGEGAKFATAFTGIALAGDSGLSHTLVEALGPSRAAGLMMLGDRFTAAQALDWGLVHRVVPDAELGEAAAALARTLADGPTAAYTQVKALVSAASTGLSDALERERVAAEELGQSRDHRAAVDAFLAKRTPTFEGR
ncbi:MULTISPECIES: enoyl-CoA hydratase-related protein [unclassified Rhodococcus (in: high G+C Gram-positive bacteria)]|uniref:enoyl-CoA hydratase-related protein n=1 Tax=unclassified Rhodococcus (in: high G+C Gram-positive bacteria) TaxID=192944 RepID=UPI00163B494D|nr:MULTISPECIES: enoyl-CoA hydratase-related protein [unclassified Rhodococcus (in: high G+C Gram-positive bacteria)]MBC2640346.1 enoyl-CoA hydratase/isomerase family protein [Rhodococcus sp. 3A]MBC2894908.1 enoyl-CoA hydratase/isomerase family protein [Rhodococcus sp. 4CII]